MQEAHLMMNEGIWIVICALAHDHGIQLVHHGQQQLKLVSILVQVDEDVVPQQELTNLCCDSSKDWHVTGSSNACSGSLQQLSKQFSL